MKPTDSLIKYRADIDGLRAIAVLAVIVYHFFPVHLKGGFVGVDVFFVISGFLVTGIVCAEIEKSSFSFANFYQKRVLRLAPALLFVLLASLAAGWLSLLPSELLSLGKHTFGGSIFLSNIFLYYESGYFDQASDLKPLLHLWSLAIEEQFYLFWPLLLVFASKIKVPLRPLLVLVVILSLIVNVYFVSTNQAFAFYSIVTRLWELALGGLIYVEKESSFLKPRENSIFKTALPALAVAVLCFSFTKINQDRAFPGAWALLPCLATSLLIINGLASTRNRWLRSKALVYIGLISYPLYLVHWPLLAFSNIVFSGLISTSHRLLLFALSLVIAMAIYEFLEKPIRGLKPALRLPITVALVSALVFSGGIGAYLWISGGAKGRFKALEALYATKAPYVNVQAGETGKWCNERFENPELCSISDSNREPTVALVGDSHANHLWPGLAEHYSKKGENLLLLGRSGTPPFIDVVSKRSTDQTLNDFFDFVLASKSIHTVILSGFWENYYQENGVLVGGEYKYKNIISDKLDPDELRSNVVFERGYLRTLAQLRASEKNAIFVYDIPTLPFKLALCFARPFVAERRSCHFESKEEGYRLWLNGRTSASRVTEIDLAAVICPAGKCNALRNGTSLYSDEHHLSANGSRFILGELDFE